MEKVSSERKVGFFHDARNALAVEGDNRGGGAARLYQGLRSRGSHTEVVWWVGVGGG